VNIRVNLNASLNSSSCLSSCGRLWLNLRLLSFRRTNRRWPRSSGRRHPPSPIGCKPLGPIRANPRQFERFAQLFELSVFLRSAVAKLPLSSTVPCSPLATRHKFDYQGDLSSLRSGSRHSGHRTPRSLAGFPATIVFAGTLRVTTDPAANTASSPISTPGPTKTLAPTQAPAPTVIGALR
jgi:hypothetical protein